MFVRIYHVEMDHHRYTCTLVVTGKNGSKIVKRARLHFLLAVVQSSRRRRMLASSVVVIYSNKCYLSAIIVWK